MKTLVVVAMVLAPFLAAAEVSDRLKIVVISCILLIFFSDLR